MKRKTRATASSLFLMELTIAILVFALGSAFCVKLFIKSDNLSRDAMKINTAVNECSGIAELISVSDSAQDAIAGILSLYPLAEIEQNADDNAEFTLNYDQNLAACSATDARLSVKVHVYVQGGMLHCDMSADDIDYRLNVRHNLPGAAI